MKNNKFNLRWLTSVNRLVPMINLLHHKPRDCNLYSFVSEVESMIVNHGEKYTIEKLKACRLVLQQYCLRQTVTPVPFCKADKDSFPKPIRFLKPDINDVYSMRYSLSFMRIIDTFRCKPEYIVSTITNESSARTKYVQEITKFIQTWPGIKLLPELGRGRPVMSNRAGPNGPATYTALEDLAALQQDPELYSSVKKLLSISTPYFFPESYETSHFKDKKHSKLVLLSDIACKTRVIAIADWWSNTALSCLHDAFMKGLDRLKGDVTYRQDEIPKLIKGLGNRLYSSDMTAFTDRFPIELETEVVKAAYGCEISELWKQVISERTFYHPKGDVKYQCGNPMGLLSSWAVSTFTHHAVKAYCASKQRRSKYKYLILGDDTLDTNKAVYDQYIRTIKGLGVPISLSKCTQSKSGYAEFAKRLFSPEGEITGLPVNLLTEIYNKPEQVLELVRICRERGYEDYFLRPSVQLLLNRHSKGGLIADMLSLPAEVAKAPPLLEVNPDRTVSVFTEMPTEIQDKMYRLASDHIFWKTTQELNKFLPGQEVIRATIPRNHPLVFGISQSLDMLLPEEAISPDGSENEFFIYEQWTQGNYRQLVNIPTIDTYRYYNKGHKATKCKFDVLKSLFKLLRGDTSIALNKQIIYKDEELFNMGFDHLQKSFELHQSNFRAT